MLIIITASGNEISKYKTILSKLHSADVCETDQLADKTMKTFFYRFTKVIDGRTS